MSTRTAFLVAVPSTLLVAHGLHMLADVVRGGWRGLMADVEQGIEGLWR